jgi:hypothetical protein
MMLMVIQGHNENDAKMRADFSAVFDRRAVLLAWARHVEEYGIETDVVFRPALVGRYTAGPTLTAEVETDAYAV